MNHSPPNVPLGREVGDIEIIDSTPSDIRYVAGKYSLVIGCVKHIVHQF